MIAKRAVEEEVCGRLDGRMWVMQMGRWGGRCMWGWLGAVGLVRQGMVHNERGIFWVNLGKRLEQQWQETE